MNTLKQILKSYYGYDSFRPMQEEIIQHTIEGGDSLVLSIETKDVVKDFVKGFVKDFVKGIPQEILKELTERQLVILDMIASDSTISAKAISEKISEKTSEKTSEKKVVTDRTIENDIAKIKELGILRRKGGRKNGEWEIMLDFKDIDK